VATVDENGKVTAVGTGSADIKGTPKNSSKTLSSSCRVTVTATGTTESTQSSGEAGLQDYQWSNLDED
jgi:uncharacterized protein YjdB